MVDCVREDEHRMASAKPTFQIAGGHHDLIVSGLPDFDPHGD